MSPRYQLLWLVASSETLENLSFDEVSGKSGKGLKVRWLLTEDIHILETQGDEVRRWQEEEFQRKLRGEYEEMQKRLHEVVCHAWTSIAHMCASQ
jgi:hypothetical protein